MHKKQTLTFAGIGLFGTAALLAGCGGSSFSKNTFGNYPNTLPYAYGLEPIAYYGAANAAGNQAAIEGSGLQAASGGQAFITGNTAFVVVGTNPDASILPTVSDPNGTKTLPTAFSAKGQYVDAVNQTGLAIAPVTAVPAGTSVIFRAAIANGVSNNAAAGITGATLTSTDTQLASIAGITAGLPMSLNIVGGAFSNATYSTGTNGTDAPFTIPASTNAGLHTVAVTVADSATRATATTFIFPVVTPSTVCLFAQNVTADGQTVAEGKTATVTPITPGDTVTIDGAAGTGTYPATYKPNVADPQGTVVFFIAPGTHTLVDTTPVAAIPAKGTAPAVPATTLVTTQTITIPATAAGTTIIQ